jgi:hypothetical protein
MILNDPWRLNAAQDRFKTASRPPKSLPRATQDPPRPPKDPPRSPKTTKNRLKTPPKRPNIDPKTQATKDNNTATEICNIDMQQKYAIKICDKNDPKSNKDTP